MRTKNNTTEQKSLSFIEQARRAQLIACAIETIAELGYAQASLAQIGQRANISKGVITYHFASKEALMQAVINEVFNHFATFVVARIKTEQPWEALCAFLQANADFLKAHRTHMLALFEIAHHAHDLATSAYNRAFDIEGIAQLLITGQQQGMFRAFDPQMMAVAILALRDSIIAQAAQHTDFDSDRYTQEIITLIEHAVQQS